MTTLPNDARPESGARAQHLPSADKLERLQQNRHALDQDLLQRRLQFASRPRVVEFQLSNFCNMSCTMCYDGDNPPMQRMPDEQIERFAKEVFPTASILSPFVGSEPLIITWDTARSLAERYELELDLITNAQFLDEEKFKELEPHVSSLSFSIDSHLRDVYEHIRLRSKPDKVFANLPRAAELCLQHGIEPQANVVFMVENAPFIDETVAYLADQGCTTVRMLDFVALDEAGPERTYSDAMRHLSDDWVQWMLRRVEKVAAEKRIRFMLTGRINRNVDHRPAELEFREDGKQRLSPWHELPYVLPGYCPQSVDHIKVHADGDAYPCCVAGGDTLKLGNVFEDGFDAVWNGKESQDLRRGMLTGDLPSICKTCNFHTAYFLPEQENMPMVAWFHREHAPDIPEVTDATRRDLQVAGPDHMARIEAAPSFTWQSEGDAPDRYALVLALGGQWREDNRVFAIPGDATSFTIPQADWESLPGNLALWWMLVAIDDQHPERSRRSPTLRCLIRHEPIPRVEGSTLYQTRF